MKSIIFDVAIQTGLLASQLTCKSVSRRNLRDVVGSRVFLTQNVASCTRLLCCAPSSVYKCNGRLFANAPSLQLLFSCVIANCRLFTANCCNCSRGVMTAKRIFWWLRTSTIRAHLICNFAKCSFLPIENYLAISYILQCINLTKKLQCCYFTNIDNIDTEDRSIYELF